MEIEKIIERLKQKAGLWCSVPTGERLISDAATTLEQLQAENDRLKEIASCYCDMCIEQDGVLWCQSCDEKCDYCLHTKED